MGYNNLLNFVVLTILYLCPVTSPSNILVVSPTMSKSHFNVGEAIAIGLADAGHNITIISPFDYKPKNPNIEPIQLTGGIEKWEEMMKNVPKGMDAMLKMSTVFMLPILFFMGNDLSNFTMFHPNVQALFGRKYDLIVVEVFATESIIGLGQKFNAPVIGFSTLSTTRWTNDLIGNPSPLSYVSHSMLDFPDKMNFWHRMYNTVFYVYESALLTFFHHPLQRSIYNHVFPDAKITYDEAIKNVALIFVNSHFSLAKPLPYVPNTIEVGGMHVNRKAKPLPQVIIDVSKYVLISLYGFYIVSPVLNTTPYKFIVDSVRQGMYIINEVFKDNSCIKFEFDENRKDIGEFIESAKDGVVYFSLGSFMKSADFPIEKRDMFINAFAKLKQKIIWKFEDETVPMPNNVFTSSWLPQNDILAHKNVIAFISHGGLLGSTEAVYHAVPIIGIPFFGDQQLNVKRASEAGWAVLLEYDNITTASVEWALNEILGNKKYLENAKLVSQRYRDQPMTPMETMVFWSEYIIRHKGAPHLRSASLDLNYFQYHNLDVFLVLISVIGIVIYAIKWSCSKICCRGSKVAKKSHRKKYQ